MSDKYVLSSLQEIASAIKAGCEDVFRSVYNAEYLNLLCFVRNYTHNKHDAEDLVQETMMTVWENRDKIDPEKNLISYLYTIAKHKTLNYLRDNAKRAKEGSLQESEYLINCMALSSSSVEDEINAMELQGFIERVFLSLPEKFVETFRLNRVEGLTYNEIAEKLGISVKVVEYHICITLKALRLRLSNLENCAAGRLQHKS